MPFVDKFMINEIMMNLKEQEEDEELLKECCESMLDKLDELTEAEKQILIEKGYLNPKKETEDD